MRTNTQEAASRPEKHPPLLTEGNGDSLGYRGHRDEQTFETLPRFALYFPTFVSVHGK